MSGEHNYAHFNSLIVYGVMFKVTLFVQQGICFNYITTRLSNTICYIFTWVMTWPNPTKSHVPTLNCWTRLAHSILIRLKQALSLQNTEIWTMFNLLSIIIIRICINIYLLILLLYVVLENCVFYVTMNKKNYPEK